MIDKKVVKVSPSGSSANGHEIKVAQNVLKYILVLKILKSYNFRFKIANCKSISGCEWV